MGNLAGSNAIALVFLWVGMQWFPTFSPALSRQRERGRTAP